MNPDKRFAYECDEANFPEAPEGCVCKVQLFREIWGDRFFRPVCGAGDSPKHCPKICRYHMSDAEIEEMLKDLPPCDDYEDDQDWCPF